MAGDDGGLAGGSGLAEGDAECDAAVVDDGGDSTLDEFILCSPASSVETPLSFRSDLSLACKHANKSGGTDLGTDLATWNDAKRWLPGT